MPRAPETTDGTRRRDARPSSADGTRSRARQLDDGDSVFVAVECPEAPSHVAGLTIVDPSDAPGFDFERFRGFLRERIGRIERFRWKLMELPFGIDRAYWIEAEGFEFDDHLHRIALPSPGDRVALGEIAGLLHEQPLDRSRPLWECWWIEGLEGGRVATLLKLHHSLMDGESAIGLAAILMDLSPLPPGVEGGPPLPPPVGESAPRRPGLWEIARGAVAHGFERPRRMAEHAGRVLRQTATRTLAIGDAPAAAPPVPRTPFNDRLSRRRDFAFATLPLGPIRDVKKHFGVTINDVLLEIISSSLRFGLSQTDDLPEQSVVALCPVSERSEEDRSFGNQISSMSVSLATDLPDPVARLLAIQASSRAAKRRHAGGAFETLAALGECFVPGALSAVTRAAHSFPSLLPLPGNLVVSNVRGLPVPTYMAGARVVELYPLSMLQVANGINVTAVSHDDQVDVGFLVDAKLVPDPWIYAEGVRRALDELEDALAYRVWREREARPEGGRAEEQARPDPTTGEDGAAAEAPRDEPADAEIDAAVDAAVGQEPEPEEEVGPADAPLDLQLIMGSLEHVRAPARTPGAPASKNAKRRGDTPASEP